MTPAGMVALRMAATLVHGLPGLRVRLRDGERTLLEVAHPAHASGPAMGPCSFRRAVACGHEHLKAGSRLAFMGLPEGIEPAVDIGVGPGDRALPGGIYRVAFGEQTVHGFATTLPPRWCRELLGERVTGTGPETVRLHHDAATEITFVHTVCEPRMADMHHRRMEDVLGAFVADEVLQDLVAAGR